MSYDIIQKNIKYCENIVLLSTIDIMRIIVCVCIKLILSSLSFSECVLSLLK